MASFRASVKGSNMASYIIVPNSGFSINADLVLLAMGFIHTAHNTVVEKLGLKIDNRGNIEANDFEFKTSAEKIFAAGDSRRGQSLVVWAIREGRQCAYSIDKFLMGKSKLTR